MITPASRLRAGTEVPHEFFAETFRRQISTLESNTLRYHIPRLHHLYERHPSMPYHFKPEFFMQLAGVTEFIFPDQRITLHPGEVCLVPKGMPHGEVARGGEAPFENVVVSYYNDTIDIHVAHEREPGLPGSDNVHFFTTELYQDMIGYLDRICEFHHHNPRVNAIAIKGLLLAEFSLLLTLVEAPGATLPTSTDTISLSKWLIQHNLQDENLGLQSLADELGCSPNYLSKLFHRRVGERIVERINRLRIQSGIDALRRTRLSVKAIAAGCGYSDPNYFCRVFRQATGRSPQQYREDVQRINCTLEKPPPGSRADERSGAKPVNLAGAAPAPAAGSAR